MTNIVVRADAVVERLVLDDTSWIDVVRGWLEGADELYELLVREVPWRENRNWRYDHAVTENRLHAGVRFDGRTPLPHESLVAVHRGVREVAGVPFSDGFTMMWYRDGNDGQGFHRDDDMKWTEDTRIAILTLGATRPWHVRPRSHRNQHGLENRGATHDLRPASGDLLVMGGRCQADWEHCVPVQRTPVRGRISLQWRWTSRTGRQERTAGFGAPLSYSRRGR